MPVGVPRKPSTGTWYVGLSASVISYISRVASIASATSPPTNFTIAGAAAIAKPPMPPVSVMAESPMSGLASSGPNAPRYRPSGVLAGPVNHWSPVPETWMPKSVPLRAIATTSDEPGTSRAASQASLQAGMPRLRKKWSLPPTKRAASATSDGGRAGVDQVGQQLAQEHQRPGAVAVVPLVAHLQHLGRRSP